MAHGLLSRLANMEAHSLAPAVDRSTKPARTVSEHLVDLLHHLGVREAFGLIGGAIAPLCGALGQSRLTCYQLRHEAGALFAAAEASLATGRPVAVFVTTGPGLTNALTGALAARWEGARIILISGATSAAQRGRWAVQETSARTLPASGVLTAGPIFDYATAIEHPAELAVIAQRLAHGLARPHGFVAHLSMPIAMQLATAPAPKWPSVATAASGCADEVIDDCVERIQSGSLVIWVGFGARGAAEEIRLLAERAGARVMCSPRGKGIFPERHPQYLGVTGCGGHEAVERHLAAARPAHTLVLGSRLSEFSSCWSAALVPSSAFIHVDLDAEVFGAAYPDVPTLGVQCDVRAFLRAVLRRIDGADAHRGAVPHAVDARPALRSEGPVRPRALMAALQDVVVDGSDALVMAESGNAFAWTNHELRFDEPGRYRVSGLWGSMGHATSGVVGAALARKKKAVAVVGDGAMLMMNEVSSAVQYDAPAVWVVLNDAMMSIVDRGMSMLGFEPFHTHLPATDFAAIARAMGAEGIRVEREADLDAALRRALASDKPCVVDVRIDPRELAPSARRHSTLSAMGASKT